MDLSTIGRGLLIIENNPLTEEFRKEISEFIRSYNSTLKETNIDLTEMRKRQKLT